MEQNGRADRKARVAIVGTGMAGLATAWLLQQDQKKRYEVVLYESGSNLSLDSASISIPNPSNDTTDRVDLPMRAFAGGFYGNLRAMYDHLEVEYKEQPFIFSFVYGILGKDGRNRSTPYFVHASNNHIFPPIRPEGHSTLMHAIEVVYVLVCYTWFTICCMCAAQRSANDQGLCESLDAYLKRIWLPEYFVCYYLLPLMAGVTTCTHEALRGFPASDLIDYKKRTHRAPHFAVANGVHQVQEKLSKGLNVRLRAKVTKVKAVFGGSIVTWVDAEEGNVHNEQFDTVILAVAPDIVKAIYEPLQDLLARLPTVEVESVVHGTATQRNPGEKATAGQTTKAQNICLRTEVGTVSRTESIHEQASGIIVTTCPFSPIPDSQVIQRSKFTRVLRTPESKQIVNHIFRDLSKPEFKDEKLFKSWRNGDDGVYLVGGWCWDGMVLLEGCIVSAMRVADALNIEIPWRAS